MLLNLQTLQIRLTWSILQRQTDTRATQPQLPRMEGATTESQKEVTRIPND